MFIWHFEPVKPVLQVHWKEFIPSVQIPPFLHGLGSQSLMFVWQVAPVNPVAHEQVKKSTPSVQFPSCSQGLGSQSSMLLWQVEPVKPGGQMQTEQSLLGAPLLWQYRLHGTGKKKIFL